jgi:L-fuconolactonase
MKLIDTHTHAWGRDTPELPWEADVLPPAWSGSYTHGRLVDDMYRLGIDESVVVTTPLYGRGRRANEYTMRSIEAHPERLYGIGLVDFMQEPDMLRASLRRVLGHERMLGVRMHAAFEYAEIPSVQNPEASWILDSRLEPVFDELGGRDEALFVFPKAQQLSMVAELAETYPDVSIVVDHMAWPDETTAPDESPWTDFQRVAAHGNTYVKVSSLPRSATTEWPYPDLHGYVRNLTEWFGPERLMLGSDYPWMDDWGSYGECLSWIEEVDSLSARDYSYLAHRTFERLHGE